MAVFTVLFSFILLAVWMLIDARHSARSHAVENLSNLSRMLSHDIESTIEIYDLSLQSAQDGLHLSGIATLPADMRHAVLFDRSAGSHYFGAILVVNANGQVVYSSIDKTPNYLTVQDRDYFQALRTQTEEQLILSHPLRSRVSGQNNMVLARRLTTANGAFAGAVIGGLRLNYFRDLFERVQLYSGSQITLVMTDGTLLGQLPYDQHLVGSNMMGSPVFKHLDGQVTGTFEADDPSDNVRRLYSFHRVGFLPLVLAVATPLDAVYAEWRQRALLSGLIGVPLLVVALWLGWTLTQELERRSRAEEATSLREMEFRATFDHAEEGMFLLRVLAPGRYVLERANAVLIQFWGLPLAAMEGREPQSFLSAHLIKAFEEHWNACVERGEVVRFTVSVSQADHQLELETVMTPIRNQAGQITMLLGSIRDASAQAEISLQLSQAQRLDAVGRIAAGVMHDFNNLLQTLTIGFRDILLGLPQSEIRTRMLSTLATLSHGVQLTRRLLAFSKHPMRNDETVSMDPAEAILALRELLAWSVGTKIQVETMVSANVWPVKVDAAQLDMCLLNLVVNARDAMPNGGKVLVMVRNATERESRQSGLAGVDHVVVTVQDTGIGMDATTRARVFEAFFSTKRSDRGTGLGLWMVRSFTQLAGGDVRIESEPGHGTQVSLWLPRCTEPVVRRVRPELTSPDKNALLTVAQAGDKIQGSGAVDGARPARILLVDDDQLVLQALERLLIESGHDVTAVSNAHEGLHLLEAGQFDLLIVDQSIPGMTGSELVHQAARLHPGLPSMIITGYSQLDDVTTSARILHKPIDADALLAEVALLISPAAAAAAAEMDV